MRQGESKGKEGPSPHTNHGIFLGSPARKNYVFPHFHLLLSNKRL